MCTNVALVDSLECYMDELVESFQDFVKKSLLIITLAVGSLIGLLLYILKLVKQRNANFAFADMPVVGQGMENRLGGNINAAVGTETILDGGDLKMGGNNPKSDSAFDTQSTPRKRCCNPTCGATTSFSTNYMTTSDVNSSKEFKNVGLSGCATSCTGKSEPDRPSSRTTIPSLPTCDALCKNFKPLGPRTQVMTRSCCSMCCGEKQ